MYSNKRHVLKIPFVQFDSKRVNPLISSTHPDSWDRNYYYNNYNTRPSAIDVQKRNPSRYKEMKYWCCGNSIRYLILLLAFLIISSLVANLLLYNLVIIHSQDPVGPTNITSNSGLNLVIYILI